jgi:hypothetical protein
VKRRSTMVKRHTAIYSRLNAPVEFLGPAWYGVIGTEFGKPIWLYWPATPTRTH